MVELAARRRTMRLGVGVVLTRVARGRVSHEVRVEDVGVRTVVAVASAEGRGIEISHWEAGQTRPA